MWIEPNSNAVSGLLRTELNEPSCLSDRTRAARPTEPSRTRTPNEGFDCRRLVDHVGFVTQQWRRLWAFSLSQVKALVEEDDLLSPYKSAVVSSEAEDTRHELVRYLALPVLDFRRDSIVPKTHSLNVGHACCQKRWRGGTCVSKI